MVLLIVSSQSFPDFPFKTFDRNFAVVMGPCTSRYGPKVSRNLGGFFRNNETKFGWVLNETWTQAKGQSIVSKEFRRPERTQPSS